MQTNLADFIKDTARGREADSILRACVHCGFCTATCPTYQLLGDELDGPRGRIYLIKQVLEGQRPSTKTQLHLDRCLTCRACETTCPSGVRYGRLIDIGRHIVEEQVPRPLSQQLQRAALRAVVPYPKRFATLLRLGQSVRGVLPPALRTKVPPPAHAKPWPTSQHKRKMLVLDGCAQPAALPNTNAAAARVLDRLGITLLRADSAGCCGALSHHLSEESEAHRFMRANVDAWWPHIEAGAEAIVMTASGCGVMVRDYGKLLADDPRYADKASRVAELTRDLSEVLAAEDTSDLSYHVAPTKVAFHSPCTLQHGQQLRGAIETLLQQAGYELTPVPDAHLCCGSAGTYSILQPLLSQQLLANKLRALNSGAPACIATANVGCQMHLDTRATVPVKHWIELLDEALV